MFGLSTNSVFAGDADSKEIGLGYPLLVIDTIRA